MSYYGKNFIDHIPLDNIKCNLRIVTPTQNSSSHKNSSSKYIGGSFNKNKNT